MIKNKNTVTKVVAIAAILVVVGLGIGFAAFTGSLTINSSANVTPESTDLGMRLTKYSGSVCTKEAATTSITGTGTGTGSGSTQVDAPAPSGSGIIGLKIAATLKKPGDKVTFDVCAHNAGQYQAYLNSVTLGTPTCTPSASNGGTKSLVDAACSSIRMTVQVGSDPVYTANNPNISSHSLAKDATEKLTITVEYLSTGPYVDGNFDVKFGTTTLKYDTVD